MQEAVMGQNLRMEMGSPVEAFQQALRILVFNLILGVLLLII